MPEFIEYFIEEAKKKQRDITWIFSDNPKDENERILKEKIKYYWHNLPLDSQPIYRTEFAVDGSRATRSFSNGAEMLVVRSLMIGMDQRYKQLFLDVYRGAANSEATERYARIISHLLETDIILNNIDELDGSIVLIDGSIHGRYLHSLRMWPLHIIGREDVPLKLLNRHLQLLKECKKRDIMMIGISKTSQIRAYSSNITGGKVLIPDSEILYRWTEDKGFTTPLMLGNYGFDRNIAKLLIYDPEKLAKNLTFADTDYNTILKTIMHLRNAPSIVTFFMRLNKGEPTIRVDVPGYVIGVNKSIISDPEFIDPEQVYPILNIVINGYGGNNVHNALLYTVDRLVRLKKSTVDKVYIEILRNITGETIEFDRSYRRSLQ